MRLRSTAFEKFRFETVNEACAGNADSADTGIQTSFSGGASTDFPRSNNPAISFLLFSRSCLLKVLRGVMSLEF